MGTGTRPSCTSLRHALCQKTASATAFGGCIPPAAKISDRLMIALSTMTRRCAREYAAFRARGSLSMGMLSDVQRAEKYNGVRGTLHAPEKQCADGRAPRDIQDRPFVGRGGSSIGIYVADCAILWRAIARKTAYCRANATSFAPPAPTETNHAQIAKSRRRAMNKLASPSAASKADQA